MPTPTLNRRTFPRASGVALGLPMLEAMGPRSVLADSAAPGGEKTPPRRMVAICASMGLLPKHFFPEQTGADYDLPDYLRLLEPHRKNFTVFSGTSHPEVDGGHHAEGCFLTAAPHPGASGFRNTISLDQYAAERIGFRTREPSLVLHAGPGGQKNGLSYTAAGVMLPAEDKPSQVYKRLFLSGSESEVEQRVRQLRVGRSVLDAVSERAKQLESRVGKNDRHKLDEYFTSVRELEQRMLKAQQWERTPKPKVEVPMPKDIKDNSEIVGKARLMYQMAALALQTDSTRVITIKVHSYGRVNIEGVEDGHHQLTHHGNRPDAIAQLRLIEEARLHEFRDFLDVLAQTEEQDASLLDRTMVLYGSHMGDANTHSNRNLPVLLAGGGFRHGRHLAFDRQQNEPLPNLYVSMLQRLGIETDRFASSTGTISGLEMAG